MRNEVAALRRARGLSQVALAEALDVSRQTINSIENGRYDLSLPLALRIGRLSERQVEEIFILT